MKIQIKNTENPFEKAKKTLKIQAKEIAKSYKIHKKHIVLDSENSSCT